MTPTRTPTTRSGATSQPSHPRPASPPSRSERDGGRRNASALERAIEPVGADEFFAAYWEDRPLVLTRREAGRFDDLLAEADVERLVCSGSLRYPAFRLVKEGAKLFVRDYTEDVAWRPEPFAGTANVERVLAEFEAGATIVLQALHMNWQPLAAFCRELEQEIGHPVQANAYYTPRASQGLPVHHDTHDVFVLQVAGDKRWLVYEPVFPLPLKDQRYSPEMGVPGQPVQDVTLTSGDSLYLPRGWLHEALTSTTDSLHVTIGVNVYTRLDAVRAALDSCADDVDFRRAVSPDDGVPAADLAERLRARLGPEQVARRQRARFVRTRRPLREGQLSQLRALDHLTPDTLVERRPTVVADFTQTEETATITFEGKEVVFPGHAAREAEYAVSAKTPFRARELPGELDAEGRLVLVRRLVREGFLRASDELGPDAPSSRNGGGAGG